MSEKIIEANYNITKKSKLRIFYDTYKFLIISSFIIVLILFGSINFYFYKIENKKIKLSENYVQAKVYLQNGNKDKATIVLKKIIFLNDPTYSTLSLLLILNQKLITSEKEISIIFDHLLSENKFDSEIKNLLVYKKILFSLNFLNELELLELIKPLLKSESVWKPHALLLLGDYFSSRNENLKAKEFYMKIFAIKNLSNDLYEQASSQLALISND